MSEHADLDRVLACGHTVGELLDWRADGEPAELAAHAAGCQHCQATLAELTWQWAPVEHTARESVPAPRGLVERTLATVHELRSEHGGSPVELRQPGGRLRLAPQALRVLAWRLCQEVLAEVAGVHLRGCTGGADAVQIALLVRYPLPAAQLAEQVQARVAERLAAVLGAASPPVFVRVVDTAPATSDGR